MIRKLTVAFLALAAALTVALPALARTTSARHGNASSYGRAATSTHGLYNYAPGGFSSQSPGGSGGGSAGYNANMQTDQW